MNYSRLQYLCLYFDESPLLLIASILVKVASYAMLACGRFRKSRIKSADIRFGRFLPVPQTLHNLCFGEVDLSPLSEELHFDRCHIMSDLL